MLRGRKQTGFTIVELLIVIVVIAVLAAITIVAYDGIQQRGRDSQRESDIKIITKALEMYYLDNDTYPPGVGSTSINNSWSSTAENSWSNLSNYLVPKYISFLPRDPISTPNTNAHASGYNYAYFADQSGYYCNSKPRQVYILVYRFESKPQENTLIGTCISQTGGPHNLGPYNSSNIRVVK